MIRCNVTSLVKFNWVGEKKTRKPLKQSAGGFACLITGLVMHREVVLFFKFSYHQITSETQRKMISYFQLSMVYGRYLSSVISSRINVLYLGKVAPRFGASHHYFWQPLKIFGNLRLCSEVVRWRPSAHGHVTYWKVHPIVPKISTHNFKGQHREDAFEQKDHD